MRQDNFGSDELGVRLWIDGEQIAEFGDYYHDKGSEKAEGFIAGYCYAKGIQWDGNYETEEIADPDFY